MEVEEAYKGKTHKVKKNDICCLSKIMMVQPRGKGACPMRTGRGKS